MNQLLCSRKVLHSEYNQSQTDNNNTIQFKDRETIMTIVSSFIQSQ